MVLGFLKNLFTGSGEPQTVAGDPVEYNGYTITPMPQKAESGWRVSGAISKQVDGEEKTHTFIRADTSSDTNGAIELTVMKAKRVIDEQGDRIFRNA